MTTNKLPKKAQKELDSVVSEMQKLIYWLEGPNGRAMLLDRFMCGKKHDSLNPVSLRLWFIKEVLHNQKDLSNIEEATVLFERAWNSFFFESNFPEQETPKAVRLQSFVGKELFGY